VVCSDEFYLKVDVTQHSQRIAEAYVYKDNCSFVGFSTPLVACWNVDN